MRIVLTSAILALFPAQAMAGAISPHRAIYNLQMEGRGSDSNLASVDGLLAFEVSEAGCDGWTVSFRMANRYKPLEGDVRLVDTQSTAYETTSGTQLDYREKTFLNQKLESESRLKVNRDSAGAAGTGSISLPSPKEFALDAGALFPIQHQVRIMDLASKGVERDVSTVFDGSEDDKPIRTITFIGKEKAGSEAGLDAANAELGPLRSLRAWPVTMSYYDIAGDNQDVPNYSIAFDLFENGVATGLHMDYGAFKMSGTLSKLEFFDAEKCE